MEEHEIIGESLDKVMRTVSDKVPEKVQEEFAHLKTDQARMDFVLKLDAVHEIIAIEPDFSGKSAAEAKNLREQGNVHFQKRRYLQALECYTKCICHAPMVEADVNKETANQIPDDASKQNATNKIAEPAFNENAQNDTEQIQQVCNKDAVNEKDGPSDLALAFANRSATLFHLKKYDLCLQDIKHALEHGYPEELQYKLFDREGKCYLQLKENKEKAIGSFQKASKYLSLSKLDDKGRASWEKTIQKQLDYCENLVDMPIVKPSDKHECPKVMGEMSSTHPKASEVLGFKSSKDVGRHGYAKQYIRVGSVLMVESPFASVTLPKFYNSHCYHCQKRVVASIPCTKCSNIVFCSKECREEAWAAYHRYEYQYMAHFDPEWCGKIGHLVLRIAILVGFKKLVQYLKNVKNDYENIETMGFNENGVYAEDYHAIHNLVTNVDKRVPDGLMDFSYYAVFLLKILQASGYFAEAEMKIDGSTRYSEELVVVGGALLRLLQIVQCNTSGIIELQTTSDFDNPSPADVGMGLYPTASLLNHSCDPDADLNFYGNKLVVRATRSVFKGKSVNIDYGVVFYKNPLGVRFRKLMFNHCFDCLCPACENKWPLWRELPSVIPTFCCEKCHRELPVMSMDKDVRCQYKSCSCLQNVQERLKKLEISHDFYAGAMEDAVHGKTDSALERLEDHMLLMQQCLLNPWRDFAGCQAAIRQCYRFKANTRDFP